MFLDVSFAMTSRGFEAVMTCMEEAMPHVARRDFEDAWATVMHVFACASQWVAAGDGQPWAQAVLCRLSSLLHFGIWGAIALDLEPHPTRPGHCLVPARYKKVSHGWQVYGGDQHLCGQALQARKLLAVLSDRMPGKRCYGVYIDYGYLNKNACPRGCAATSNARTRRR